MAYIAIAQTAPPHKVTWGVFVRLAPGGRCPTALLCPAASLPSAMPLQRKVTTQRDARTIAAAASTRAVFPLFECSMLPSGAADRGFGPRNAEHAKGAELLEEKHLNSDFYVGYRTKAASQRCPHLDPPKGSWEKLRQFVAIGFRRVETANTISLLEASVQDLQRQVAAAKVEHDKVAAEAAAARRELQPQAARTAAAPDAAPAAASVGAPPVDTAPPRAESRRRRPIRRKPAVLLFLWCGGGRPLSSWPPPLAAAASSSSSFPPHR